MKDLIHICNNAIKVLSKQSPFHKESAILSRFLYKYDQKFRNDIGYRMLKKINSALRRYLALDLLKDIQNFTAVIPSNNEDQYLPTKQMLEYVMIRIMSFAKIMIRICVCSKQASIYYLNRVKRGESHWMSLMPYALLSRIWSMSMVLLQHCCSWYSSLHPYLNQLQHKGLDFLPNCYTMPTNLDDWLDVKNLDNYGRFEWSYKKSIQINLSIAEDDEMNFDTILEFVKDVNSEENNESLLKTNIQQKLHIENLPSPPISVDQGVSISREYFQSFFNDHAKKVSNNKSHSADSVTNKITLEAFLYQEESYRNENSDLSLTKHLTFMQWQTLKTSLVNLGNLLGKSRKIEKKFRKIWQEKCLDYLE